MWHFVEEVEHRSSALIIYDAVVDDKLYRMRVLPRVVKHLMKVSNNVFEGINANVPLVRTRHRRTRLRTAQRHTRGHTPHDRTRPYDGAHPTRRCTPCRGVRSSLPLPEC